MATNRRRVEARKLNLPVDAGTVSGDPVLVGRLPGVALTDRDTAGNATIDTEGAYDLEVEASAGAIGVGDVIYIDGAGALSNDSTGDRFGYALEAIGNAETATIEVKLGPGEAASGS